MRSCEVRLALILLACGPYLSAQVQSSRLDNGCQQLETTHLRLITDLPISEEIRQLPILFERAISHWESLFGPIQHSGSAPKATVILMGDRPRFKQLGYITPELPNFAEGFQNGDQLFVCEQPSDYYRRHLMLHEGTHWYMYRALSGAGAGWYSEGLAEYIATHRWDGKELVTGVIPATREEAPYWGRIKVVQEDLNAHRAPSLQNIFEYFDREHRNVKPYAWSWAAVQFMLNHELGSEVMKRTFSQRLDYSDAIVKQIARELRDDWKQYCIQWSGFVSDLDYGTDPSLSVPTWISPVRMETAHRTNVSAKRGWQSSGTLVLAGDQLEIAASGRITLASAAKPWISEPQGISLEYHQGKKIGTLLMAIVPFDLADQNQTVKWEAIAIGSRLEISIPHDGILYFKINEHPSKLSDNEGAYSIEIHR